MKKIILIGCVGILFLVGIVSTTIFAVLYVNSQNEVKVKNAELLACSGKTSTTNTTTTTTCPSTSAPTEYTFKDDGQGIKVTYPITWSGALTTKVSSDFTYDPVYGKVISGYEYNLTKSGTTLKFKQIIAGVDGFPNGLKAATSDWKEIAGTNIVRVSDKGANDWKYVSKVACSTLSEIDPSVDVTSFGICVGSFFPGFGTTNASNVTIKTSDSALLEEADQIAKSALN